MTSAHEEQQYLNLVREVIEKGSKRPDRTGVGTHSLFGKTMRFSLSGGTIPLLTTKKVFFRAVAEELLWMIRGSTDEKELSAKRVHIWRQNASREFLDKRGLEHYPEGELGPIYGYQWRKFGRPFVPGQSSSSSSSPSRVGEEGEGRGEDHGVDQLEDAIELIKTDPFSRRIVVSAWNPVDIPSMALPPCHVMYQFYVSDDNKLSCMMIQRSGDLGLGIPFNMASYALLTHLVAKVTGLEAGELVHVIGDAHVYLNHVGPLSRQLEREPTGPFPQLVFRPSADGKKIDEFTFDDFEIRGYSPLPAVKMDMAV